MNATEFPASDDLRAIRYRFDGPVAIVELHRPHRANAWNGTMHGEFLAVMRHIETLEDVRAVVVTGTPPAFSVGGDSQALGDHAERGSYDTGLANDVVRPGRQLRQEFDEDLCADFGFPKTDALHRLKDLITGVQVYAHFKEKIPCHSGDLLLLRLVPLTVSKETRSSIHVSLHPPYLLSSSQEEWNAYFDQVLPKDEKRLLSYRRLMRSESAPLLWLEYLQCASLDPSDLSKSTGGGIWLAGVPNQVESMPHGDQAKVEFLAYSA